MITSAANRGWPDDVTIEDDYRSVGLTALSVVRPHKLTLDVDHATLVGQLDSAKLTAVMTHLHDALGSIRLENRA